MNSIHPAGLHLGDCLNVLRGMPENSVDSIVTDPPYGLGFMGRDWDHGVPGVHFWQEMLRVLKPGGHLLAFSGSRTYHRMTCAIEDAGFEVRDQIMWVYGSGFPKSLDVSKAIDKAAGAEREITREAKVADTCRPAHIDMDPRGSRDRERRDNPATDAARQWQGWGTALKPAHEPICVARKPLVGTVAENVLKFGTGAINVDGCRVGAEGGTKKGASVGVKGGGLYEGGLASGACDIVALDAGRWPANLIHDGSEEVVALFPDSNGAGKSLPRVKITGYGDGVVGSGKSEYLGGERIPFDAGTGSAARFYYCAKANKKDRGEGNAHPTVKPTDLMRYLCRLVTPPGGVVLDPFMGSGSTGKAALLEGFRFIGIEQDAGYFSIAQRRVLGDTVQELTTEVDDLLV